METEMKWLALSSLLVLAACQSMQASGNFCKLSEPHGFTDATVDVMTDAEVTREVTHNELGEELCGWRP